MSLACRNSFKRQATTRFCSFLFIGSLLVREGSQNVTLVLGLHILKIGAPGGIRTPDPLVRSQVLYPTELRAHASMISVCRRGRFARVATAPTTPRNAAGRRARRQ